MKIEKSPAVNFRKNFAAVSLIAAPALLLTGDLIASFGPGFYYARYFFCKAGLATFVFAILAIVHLLKPRADRLGLIGGGLAITGAISGTTLFSFVYLHDEMSAAAAAGFDAGAMQAFEQIFRRVYSVMVLVPLPGLAFPVGLFTLSVGLLTTKIVPRWTAGALGLGAILFPVGRIPGILPVSVASDVFLVLSMCFIGWKFLTEPQDWERAA